MRISNKKYLERITKNIRVLATSFRSNSLFLCKPDGSNIGESSIVFLIRKNNDGLPDPSGLLGTRQLLNDLKYHLEKNGDIEFTFDLKLKEEK